MIDCLVPVIELVVVGTPAYRSEGVGFFQDGPCVSLLLFSFPISLLALHEVLGSQREFLLLLAPLPLLDVASLQAFSHQGIVLELGHQLTSALEGKPCRVCIAPLDVRLPKSTEQDAQVDTVVQPDVFIVCDLQKVDARGVRGAPDWLAEVPSPGTARHDRLRKLPAYERAGVREVWLIDPIDLTLTLYRLKAGRYGRATRLKLTGKTSLTAVPGVTIDWDKLLAKIA